MKRKLLAGITLNFLIPSIIIGLFWWWEIPLFMPIGFIAVLIIHEAGHLLSMKLFEYKSLEFYLLLPFGAFVYGEKEYSKASQSAIVYLAGPIPGILIGTILAPIGTNLDSDIITFLAIIFLFINTINLLPIFPLDGGRFLVSAFKPSKKQLIIAIWVSLAVTILAMIMFRLFEAVILPLLQVIWLFILRSEKEFNTDHCYDLSKTKLVLALLGYFVSLILSIASVAYCFNHF